MSTPRNGRTMTNTTQPALAQPPASSRRNRSMKTLITIQIQATQQKKMIIVQRTSKNG